MGTICSSDGPPPALRPDRRRRRRQLLRRRPRAAHRAVERLDPPRPARAGARRHPVRPDRRRPHRGGRRRWCAGPGGSRCELDALGADVAALRDEVTGTVRLGCIGTSARWLVPLVLEAVTAAHPKVHVIVVDATTTSLVPRLLADELDLAVVNLPVANPEVVDRAALRRGPPPRSRPTDHPLAARERVALRRARRPRAPARAERHRVPRRARPRGGRRRHRAAGQGRGRRPAPDRHPRVPGVRRRHRAGHRGARLAGGELAPRAHRRARPPLGRAGPAVARPAPGARPAPSARRSSASWPTEGAGTDGVHPAA